MDGLPRRGALPARWRLCATEPGAPAPGESADWVPLERPLTAAAAWRAAGRWSLDGSPHDFDARDWWYAAQVDGAALQDMVLGFDGLATLAEVRLNGQTLLRSDSMFLAHQVRPAPFVHAGANELLVRFASVQAALQQRRPRPRWRTPMVAHQQLRWMRTTLLGRTPGWSPPAAPVGPWRDVWCCPEDQAIAWRLQPSLVAGQGQCAVELRAPAGWARDLVEAVFVLRGPDGAEQVRPLESHGGERYTAHVTVAQPALWWPHTHGEPLLSTASLRTRSRSGAIRTLALGTVGFRQVEIDRTDDGFALRVNGARIFCRGAGWTPLDPVSLRSGAAECRAAVGQVRDAGLNMLRLAGTLPPEEDHFYDACDALGVLVWQDFPFASMDYPFDDAGFSDLAAREAAQLATRLGHRACVAVLCGNSEVEQQAAMWGAPRELWQPAFFHRQLPALCAQHAPATPYWPSSAHGGAFPHQADTGTTSYYGVGAYERPLDDARRSGLRFATECLAFANVPDDAALGRLPGGLATRVHHPQWKARSPRDLGAGWDFDDVRDHYLQRLFDVDPARLRHQDHDRYLALGRLATAEAMAAAFAEWRRPASGCAGALVLQLRDLWAGAGWGLLDEQGDPKACWHALRRCLQPLAVFLTDEGGNGLAVHVVNDTPVERRLVLELSAWREGDVQVARAERPVVATARGGCTLNAIEVLGQFLDLNHAYRFGPPSCEVVRARLLEDGREVAAALHFPLGLAPLVATRSRDLGLAAAAAITGDGEAVATVRTGRCAVGVHLDVPGWQAADDHFHLAPGASRQVHLRRTVAGAALAGQVLALNAAAAVPLETQP
jgi:beta-mannosidase